jgi:hypothetical protein
VATGLRNSAMKTQVYISVKINVGICLAVAFAIFERFF